MNSKIVMSSAAVTAGILGFIFLFAPEEVLNFFNAGYMAKPFIQLLGAAILGSAASNWISRNLPIGGIYGRPVMAGNMAHFSIGFLLLARAVFNQPENIVLWILCIIYAVFAIAFSALFFNSPKGT